MKKELPADDSDDLTISLFNKLFFFSTCAALLHLVSNLLFGIDNIVNIADLAIIVFVSSFSILFRKYNFKYVFWLFIFFSQFIISSFYFLLNGIDGPYLIVALVSLLVFVALDKNYQSYYIMGFCIFFQCITFICGYFFENLVLPFPSKIFNSSNKIVLVFSFMVIVVELVKFIQLKYERKKNQAIFFHRLIK